MQKFSNRWINYFFTIATDVAGQSKDPSTKVGCVVVDKNKHILATGYNGFPVGMGDDSSRYQDRSFKLQHICHAEANAICQAAYTGMCFKDSFIFITLQPCIECSKLIIQSGIKEVHYLFDEQSNAAREKYLKEQGEDVLNDWRKSKDQALKMLVECDISVYEHTFMRSSTTNEIKTFKTSKFEFSATGDVIQV